MVMSLRSKWAVGKAVRAGLAVEGAYLDRYVTDPAAAGQPPAHFHRNPPGRGQFAFFRVARSTRMNSDMGASLAP